MGKSNALSHFYLNKNEKFISIYLYCFTFSDPIANARVRN